METRRNSAPVPGNWRPRVFPPWGAGTGNFTSPLAETAGGLCRPDCKREVKGRGEPQGLVWGCGGRIEWRGCFLSGLRIVTAESGPCSVKGKRGTCVSFSLGLPVSRLGMKGIHEFPGQGIEIPHGAAKKPHHHQKMKHLLNKWMSLFEMAEAGGYQLNACEGR